MSGSVCITGGSTEEGSTDRQRWEAESLGGAEECLGAWLKAGSMMDLLSWAGQSLPGHC